MKYMISLSPGGGAVATAGEGSSAGRSRPGELYKYWNDSQNPRSASYKSDKLKIQITLGANQLVSHY